MFNININFHFNFFFFLLPSITIIVGSIEDGGGKHLAPGVGRPGCRNAV